MRYSWLFFLFLMATSLSAQEVVKDTTVKRDTVAKKDTTIGQKIGTLTKTLIKDTVPKTETKKDTLLEKRLEKKFYGFRQFEHETFLFVEAPLRWHKTDWLRVGLTLGITAGIMPFDQPVTNNIRGDQRYYYSPFVVGGRMYGEWYSIGAVTSLFAGYGILIHDTAAKKIAIELFQAGAYSELFTEVIKIIVGRARPYVNDGPYTFRPFTLFNVDFQSSPSGHATSAFALSTVMFRHAHSTLLKILAFVPAGFTLFSRIYQNYHWVSDEFFGAAVGFATGMWVVNLHEKRRHKINVQAANGNQ